MLHFLTFLFIPLETSDELDPLRWTRLKVEIKGLEAEVAKNQKALDVATYGGVGKYRKIHERVWYKLDGRDFFSKASGLTKMGSSGVITGSWSV